MEVITESLIKIRKYGIRMIAIGGPNPSFSNPAEEIIFSHYPSGLSCG